MSGTQATAPGPVTRLRRPVYARLFGTTVQGILSTYALAWIALGIIVVSSALGGRALPFSPWLLLFLVLGVIWVRGLTAWSSFDDAGVHSRLWVRWDYPWEEIASITLQRLDNAASAQVRGAPAIVVRTGVDDADKLAPALRCGRYRREFGTALLRAANARGIKTVVGSGSWSEQQQESSEPFI